MGTSRPRIGPTAVAVTAAALAGAVSASTSAGAVTAAPPTSAAASARPTGTILVHFEKGASGRARGAALTRIGGSRIGSVHDLHVAVVRVRPAYEESALTKLTRSSTVRWAEPDAAAQLDAVTPNDPYWPNEWGAAKVNAPTVWATSTGSPTVTVAILDTGITSGLTEFTGRVLPGYNFIANSTNTSDDNGHGTDATGVALAQGNNGTGVAGLCWSCQILPVKVADASGNAPYDAVASGITWAADHGANVINLSLGGTTASTTLDSAVAYARSHGAVVVASAGNGGCNCPTYPAASPGAISVAATDSTDTLYSYSNFGTWVKVAAPGSNYTVSGSGTYFPFGGTSSAAPVVSGAAALLLAADPTATNTQIEQAITSTGAATSGQTLGGRRLDIAAALTALTGGATTSPSPSPSTSNTSTSPSPSPSPTSTATMSPSPSPSPTSTSTTTSSPAPSPTAKGRKK